MEGVAPSGRPTRTCAYAHATVSGTLSARLHGVRRSADVSPTAGPSRNFWLEAFTFRSMGDRRLTLGGALLEAAARGDSDCVKRLVLTEGVSVNFTERVRGWLPEASGSPS